LKKPALNLGAIWVRFGTFFTRAIMQEFSDALRKIEDLRIQNNKRETEQHSTDEHQWRRSNTSPHRSAHAKKAKPNFFRFA
jgi:hypothetical protein